MEKIEFVMTVGKNEENIAELCRRREGKQAGTGTIADAGELLQRKCV